MNNDTLNALLDSAPPEFAELLRERLARAMGPDLSVNDQRKIGHNEFERVLYAFKDGSDDDAYVARTILGAFQSVFTVLIELSEQRESGDAEGIMLSDTTIDIATRFMAAAPGFIDYFAGMAQVRGVALNIKQPAKVVLAELTPASETASPSFTDAMRRPDELPETPGSVYTTRD